MIRAAGAVRLFLTCPAAPGDSAPHGKMVEAKFRGYPPETLFVVDCAGPHCNGAHRGAYRLACLRRPVKLMIGGITGWLDEGFALSAGERA